MAMTASARCVEHVLGRDPVHVSRSRHQARQTLAQWGVSWLAELAELVVSELVTNAQQHGAGPMYLRLGIGNDVLRVEVHDHGSQRPVDRTPSAQDECGRGLGLLDALISVHGGERGILDDHGGPGKTVYVELPIANHAA